MTFHKRPFHHRFDRMGDESEEFYFHLNEGKVHRLGLNRPPFMVGGMEPAMRYAPDFMTRDAFVEVMGIGSDGTLKMKHEKLEALRRWEAVGPVRLFVANPSDGCWWEADLATWDRAFSEHATGGTFPEGKEFYALHVDHFPTERRER